MPCAAGCRCCGRPRLTEEQKAHALDVIDRNIGAQTQLVEDLLDISRIVTGRMRLNVQPVDLESVVNAAIDSVGPAAAAKEIRLQSAIDVPDGWIHGDPDRLQQIVWNLLSNAIKFTPRGGRVDVMVRRAEDHAELIVTDTGQGISADFLPHVFDRFRQGDSTTTRSSAGWGSGWRSFAISPNCMAARSRRRVKGRGAARPSPSRCLPVRRCRAGCAPGRPRPVERPPSRRDRPPASSPAR